jgi:hypothetical protein
MLDDKFKWMDEETVHKTWLMDSISVGVRVKGSLRRMLCILHMHQENGLAKLTLGSPKVNSVDQLPQPPRCSRHKELAGEALWFA